MAITKTNRPSEEQQAGRGELARRNELWSSRDWFDMNPFSMMRRLSEEMDRAFSTSFGLPRFSREFGGMWSPAVDVREREGNLEICAELPGMGKDEVQVECTEDAIVISGEKRSEREEDDKGWRRSERSYGRFRRVIPLPQGADTEKAAAQFKDGVLEVRVPVPESKSRSRNIPIG